jgi:uncharacterized protein YggE
LSIEVNWENFAQKGADIIAKVSEVWNINIDNSSFTLKDKNLATKAARTKAFEEAKWKAQQLADLWWVTLGKPTMIIDQNIVYADRPMYAMKEASMWWDTAMNTQPLSPGQTEITINISVTYEIK